MQKQKFSAKIKALRFAGLKNAIHPLLLKVLTFKTTGELRVDGKFPDSGNYLIVANHCCIEDIPTLGEAVQKHFFLLVSDENKPTIDGIFLSMNGVEWVHRMSKDSRRHAAAHAVEILKNGHNFAMYPESTWNLSPTALVMPMNYGCIKIALEAGVPIIPVVSSFFDTYRHTIIGEKFYPTEDLEQSISELRDIMSGYVYMCTVRSKSTTAPPHKTLLLCRRSLRVERNTTKRAGIYRMVIGSSMFKSSMAHMHGPERTGTA